MGNASGRDAIRLQALKLAEGLQATPNNISRVGRDTSEGAARWAFTQWTLRKAGQAKFTHSDQMLFTREALEQASHEWVAQFHAGRFPKGVLIADLTVGIGGDLVAFARRGPAIGFEVDPERAEYARQNLSVYGLTAQVLEEDCMNAEWPEYVWADPSRRISGARTLDPSGFSPNPMMLAERMTKCKLAGLKLSPMLKDEYLDSLGQSLEFVSFAGECREAIVWLGSQADSGRQAVRAETAEILPAGDQPISVEALSRFIYEADPAAIRAHALGTLCNRHQLHALADSNGYLTSDEVVNSNWLTCYEGLSEPTGDIRKLKSELRRLGAAKPIVKTRAKAASVPQLEKQLSGAGKREVAVMAYPLGKAVRYVVAAKR